VGIKTKRLLGLAIGIAESPGNAVHIRRQAHPDITTTMAKIVLRQVVAAIPPAQLGNG